VLRREAEEPVFRSVAAREEFERARRLRLVKRVALGAILLIAWSLVMFRLGRGRETHEHVEVADAKGHVVKLDPLGPPSAKVKVECVIPADSDCHTPVIQFLTQTSEKWPDHIRVEFRSMSNFSEDELTEKLGSVCAGVLINGTTDFELNEDGLKRHASLIGTIPTHFMLWDLGEALAQVYVKQYGDPGEPIYELPDSAKEEAKRRKASPQAEPPETQELDFKLPAVQEIEIKQ